MKNTKIKAALAAVLLSISGSVFAVDYCQNGYRMHTELPHKSKLADIVIHFKSNVPNSWRDATSSAIYVLNGLFSDERFNLNLNFRTTSTYSEYVDIQMKYINFGEYEFERALEYPAAAAAPVNAMVGREVFINNLLPPYIYIYIQQMKKEDLWYMNYCIP